MDNPLNMQIPNIAVIKIADYDLSGLPEAYQNPNAEGFEDVLKKHISEEYNADGQFTKVSIEQDTLIIAEDLEAKAKSDEGLDVLQRGIYPTGKAIFEGLYAQYPTNPIVLYNLGMVYSDEGNLTKAIALLIDLI